MNRMFLDPLYGPMTVDSLARELIFSSDFQRLRNVRLCNINSLFITGASEPKRFEHCLGVYHLANLWVEARRIATPEADIVRAAALLHDLQTGPFGHSFQYVLEDNEFQQQFEHANLSNGARKRFLQRTYASAAFAGRQFSAVGLLGDLAEPAFLAIRGAGPYGPLISGTLDLDNLDNVVRLAFHSGLCKDSDRCLPVQLTQMLSLIDGQLSAPSEAFPLFQRWFDIRRQLYKYLLLDRGEFSAKAMLTLAVELAVDADLLGPDSWKLTDEELLQELEVATVGEHQVIGQIVRRLKLGALFECVGIWSANDADQYAFVSQANEKRKIEQQIERIAVDNGAARLRCCLHYILDHKKTCRSFRYLDLSTNEPRTVGFDRTTLLVGLFVTNARQRALSDIDRAHYARAAREALAESGIEELHVAEDPLEQDDCQQAELFR